VFRWFQPPSAIFGALLETASNMRLNLALSATLLVTTQLCAQWTPLVTGMLSNRSLCEDGGDLYCATYPNGVKKSVGGTGPFTAVNNGLPMSGGNYFVQSVGTDGTYLYAGSESGIYRSADGGANWSNINGSLTASTAVYANKFFAFDGNIMAVFAGSIAQGGGIWRSGNSGDTWLIGYSGMGSNVVVNHLTQVGNTLWASTSVGLYTSTDDAQNWTAHPTVNYAVYGLASFDNTLVIASNFGMRYSTNGGTSWLDGTGDPVAPTNGELVAFDGMFFALLTAPTGCLRSTDGGVTWAAYNDGFSVVDAQAQEEFLVAGNTLYCSALFDIYSVASSGNGIGAYVPSARPTLFPTAFTQEFTLLGNTMNGDLILIDGNGRTARRVPVSAEASYTVDRGELAAGAYRAIIHDRLSGKRYFLGTLIAL